MSTRRSTRASSRQASEVSNSTAVTAPEIPASQATPVPPRRKVPPLPGVKLRTSTMYGEEALSNPSNPTGPDVTSSIEEVLQKVLQPAREDETTSHNSSRGNRRTRGRGASTTPVPVDRSFHHESNIFNRADFDSSSVSNADDFDDRSTNNPSIYSNSNTPSDGVRREDPKQELIKSLARKRLNQARLEEQEDSHQEVATGAKELPAFFLNTLKQLRNLLSFEVLGAFALILTATCIYSLFASAGQYHNYGWDIKNNVRQFLPTIIAHPLEYFNPDDVGDLQSRMRLVEREIVVLKKNSNLDDETLEKLREILPDVMVIKKDFLGKAKLPDNLWSAIQDKLRKDNTLNIEQVEGEHKSTKNKYPEKSVSIKEVERIVQGVAGKAWDSFLRANKLKLQSASDHDTGGHSSFKDSLLAHKSEVIDMIRDNWEDNKVSAADEFQKLNRRVEKIAADMAKLEQGTGGLSKAELKSFAIETLRKLIPIAQLEALAKSNMKSSLNYGLTQLNHFSKGTGAVVDPYNTSPNYAFKSMKVWAIERPLRAFMGNPVPIPNPPESALTKWEEHGDCWCSPTSNTQSSGPTLGVIMGSNIFPEQVVVEHVPASASMEPGSAPREMELLAYLPELESFNLAKQASEDIFRDETNDLPHEYPFRYVRVATWTYDMESSDNIQAFSIQVDLKALGAHTNKVIVRTKNNWGGGDVDYSCLYRVRLHGEVFATPGLY